MHHKVNLSPLNGETILKTERILCRKWLPTDKQAIYEVYSDIDAAKYVDDGKPITQQECEHWLNVTAANYQKRHYGMFTLQDAMSTRTLGFCGLIHPNNQFDAEIKYSFRKSQWSRGLASEIVPALLDYGKQKHGLTRIIATVHAENFASQKVLIKSGMQLIDESYGEDGDLSQLYEWKPTQ